MTGKKRQVGSTGRRGLFAKRAMKVRKTRYLNTLSDNSDGRTRVLLTYMPGSKKILEIEDRQKQHEGFEDAMVRRYAWD